MAGSEKRPRIQGDRPQGDRPPRPQGDRPPRPIGDRPPRRTQNEGGSGFEGEATQGDDDGFRRNNNGYRGPRNNNNGVNRGGPSGRFGKRRPNDPDHPREMDRHSGSEKT